VTRNYPINWFALYIFVSILKFPKFGNVCYISPRKIRVKMQNQTQWFGCYTGTNNGMMYCSLTSFISSWSPVSVNVNWGSLQLQHNIIWPVHFSSRQTGYNIHNNASTWLGPYYSLYTIIWAKWNIVHGKTISLWHCTVFYYP